MKRIFTFALAVAAVMTIASCGGRNGKKADNQDAEQAEEAVVEAGSTEVKAEAALPEGDLLPAEWADRYGIGQCPMTLIAGDKSTSVVFRNGGDLEDWTRTELNTEGWYAYNDRIISADGKWAIGPDIEWLSSCCDYVAQPYDGPTLKEEERSSSLGAVVAVHSFLPLWIRKISLRHDGEDSGEMAKRGICDTFTAGETINIFMDSDVNSYEYGCDSVAVYAFPHGLAIPAKGFVKEEDEAAACFKTTLEQPNDDFYCFAAKGVILNDDEDKGVGLFDIVFTYAGIISEYLTINSVKAE